MANFNFSKIWCRDCFTTKDLIFGKEHILCVDCLNDLLREAEKEDEDGRDK